MIKTAIFVEGLSERVFLSKLIYNRYSAHNVLVREMVLRGHDSYFNAADEARYPGVDFLFYIVEVPSYDRVSSVLLSSAAAMVRLYGFSWIIGLRDLIPNRRAELAKIAEVMRRLVDRSEVAARLDYLFAIMETEAWFLSDPSMPARIHAALTAANIQRALGIDIVNTDPQVQFDPPADVLDSILRIAGMRYRKHEREIRIVTDNLDYVYLTRQNGKCSAFTAFTRRLDASFTSPN